jgi:hypothetical protein
MSADCFHASIGSRTRIERISAAGSKCNPREEQHLSAPRPHFSCCKAWNLHQLPVFIMCRYIWQLSTCCKWQRYRFVWLYSEFSRQRHRVAKVSVVAPTVLTVEACGSSAWMRAHGNTHCIIASATFHSGILLQLVCLYFYSEVSAELSSVRIPYLRDLWLWKHAHLYNFIALQIFLQWHWIPCWLLGWTEMVVA